jgi:hypothetical protein
LGHDHYRAENESNKSKLYNPSKIGGRHMGSSSHYLVAGEIVMALER